MVKQKQPLPLSSITGGLITEANPLSQPAGSSSDEVNIVINNDNTRQRRLGMGLEEGGILVGKPLFAPSLDTVAYNSFKWDLSAVPNGNIYTVVQIGNTLEFYRFDSNGALSASKVDSINIADASQDKSFSFTAVDKLLVVGTDNGTYYIENVSETETPDFVETFFDLEVRDFFGVEDVVGGLTIDQGNDVQYRPLAQTEMNSIHAYNLYNQGWPNKRVWCFRNNDGADKMKLFPIYYAQTILKDGTGTSAIDTIGSDSVTPSNADIFSLYSITDTEEAPRSVEGFNPEMMDRGLEYNSESPKGNYVINLFNRGKSREEASDVYTNTDGLGSKWVGDNTVILPVDRSPRQVSAVAEFAGRVFYAGFSAEVIGGDERSPNLSSYIAFSQLIKYSKQLGQCYQAASPTNKDDPDLVATDGGTVRISGAIGIKHLEVIGNSLLVFADNGVWQIMGGADYGFSADNYQVVKVTERGCVSARSVVNVGEQAMWCADDGIYMTETTEGGYIIAKDVTKDSIKTIYDSITDKMQIFSAYDEFERTVRWVYDGENELVYKTNLGVWTKNKTTDNKYLIKGFVKVPPLSKTQATVPVVANGEPVVAGLDLVTTTQTVRASSVVELKYLSVDPVENNYTFSLYNRPDFRDWDIADAEGFMITSYFTGGDGSKHKQSPYITFHFLKTELGFDMNFDPVNQSSCLVQPRWDFSNSAVSNKYGREFQAYRFRRHFFPVNIDDEFDNGYETVITKNKVRGKGRALSLRLRTEPLKDLHLIGWEQEFTSNSL